MKNGNNKPKRTIKHIRQLLAQRSVTRIDTRQMADKPNIRMGVLASQTRLGYIHNGQFKFL